MFPADLRLLGWLWVVVQSLAGCALLLAPLVSGIPAEWFRPGQGTALLLIAASILFAAVFPTLLTNPNRLVPTASVLTAVFGYSGTILILRNENEALLALLLGATFYLTLLGFGLIVLARLIASVVSNFVR